MKPISLPGSRSRHLIIGGVVAVALATAYAALQAFAGTGLPRNARIGDVVVGGLARDAAVSRLNESYGHLDAFRVHVGDHVFEISGASEAVRVDVSATVDQVQHARWNPVALVSILRGTSQAPVMVVDHDALTTAIQSISDASAVPASNAGIDVLADVPAVIPAKAGLALDVTSATKAVLGAIALGDREIRLRRVERQPVVSTLVAQRALEEIALPAISAPVQVDLTMTDGTHRSSSITPETIRASLSFVAEGSLLTPVLDGAVLRRDVDSAIFDVQVFAKRAQFQVVDGAMHIVPSVDGFGVTNASLAKDVTSVLTKSGTDRSVSLALGAIPASFTTADAEALGITGIVSQYKQKFPAAAYRTQNIGTAARYINGTILKPGEVFSMNDTVKERTVENGYTEGWIIGPDGVFRMEQGGAVSTITTAMYNAAWFAGLQLVEHRAHSIYISRYPPGREATVSWGSFDMKFKNTLSHAILITTRLRSTSISVYFWGTKEYDNVDSVFGPRTNLTPYREIVSTDPVCHDQDGVPGFHITVWRVLYKGGVEVAREPYATSYRPSPHVVCTVNQKPKPTPKPTVKPKPTPSPTASPSATDAPSAEPSDSATPTPTT